MDVAVMHMVSYRIAISRKRLYDGIGTIVGAGYGRFTERDNQFWVTEVALDELDKYSIPYRILHGPKRKRVKTASR